MDAHLASILSGLATLSAPAVVTSLALIFMWAIASERLVLGKQYRAERARGDKYEEAHKESTKALIESIAGQQATITIVTSFREELAKLTAAKGEES